MRCARLTIARACRPGSATWVVMAAAMAWCGSRGWSALAAELDPAPEPSRPNLVLIMADDLGYETLGANGGTSYRTGRLDQLAATGMRFEHCYVQPLCTPTRVQLMTGQSNVRNYVRFGVIDPNATTFAQLLHDAGYATCIAGKWQLGREADLPRKMGFDEFYLWQHTRRPPRYANPGLEFNGVENDFSNGEYGPDLIHEHALDFIRRNRDRPFLLYYPMMLTHGPYQATPDSADWDPKAMGEDVGRRPEHFADMVAYMDKLVGSLVDHLDGLGIRERTLLLFLGDNGTGRGMKSMIAGREVTGGKGTTTARGMHVPLVANWPGTIPAGQVSSDLVDSTDFLPTLLDAAGVAFPPTLDLDGRSFLPQLKGERGNPRQWIYSWYSPRQNQNTKVTEFVFSQSFKLYRTGELFDLRTDSDEKTPLAGEPLSAEAAAAAAEFQAVLTRYEPLAQAR